MKSFEELFNEITEWQDETFGNHGNPIPAFFHLEKEIQELKLALQSNNNKECINEIADCFLLLIGIFKRKFRQLDDIDLVNLINEKLQVNKKRTWGQPDEKGVIEHIKES